MYTLCALLMVGVLVQRVDATSYQADVEIHVSDSELPETSSIQEVRERKNPFLGNRRKAPLADALDIAESPAIPFSRQFENPEQQNGLVLMDGRSRNRVTDMDIPRCAKKDKLIVNLPQIDTIKNFVKVNNCALLCNSYVGCRYWMIYFPVKATPEPTGHAIGECVRMSEGLPTYNHTEGWFSGETGCYQTENLDIPRCAKNEEKYVGGKISQTSNGLRTVNECARLCHRHDYCRYWMIYFPERSHPHSNHTGTIGECIELDESPTPKLESHYGWLSGESGCYE